VEEFHEKPARPALIPGDPSRAYASMGNYLFNPRVLVALLEEASRRGDTDFGRHIMPRLQGRHGAFAYDFASNKVPGIQPHEERGYWRDVGTLDAYQAAQRDVLDPLPRFSLENPQWPIRGGGCRVAWAEGPGDRLPQALIRRVFDLNQQSTRTKM
jgi:glucose-1-phosphate adenylyltransferase